jgi:hypothetical protein
LEQVRGERIGHQTTRKYGAEWVVALCRHDDFDVLATASTSPLRRARTFRVAALAGVATMERKALFTQIHMAGHCSLNQ